MGEIDFPQAAAEFQAELSLHPDDVLSRAQLGYIELSQHKYDEAEKQLIRATELNPRDPDTFVSLGQLYVDTSRPGDAEPALRKAIALTADPSHNHYQVQRAHYLLGRILLQTGRREEAKTEMQTSTDLLKLGTLQNQGKTAEEIAASAKTLNLPKREQPELDDTALQQVEKLEGELGQPVADSYNNLGVTAAREGNYTAAVESLEKASRWNPTLDGLDVNLGRAAYLAKQYAKAVQPLRHVVDRNPQNAWFRTALGVSLFMTGDYNGTVKTLRPMEASLSSTPGIEPIYAASLVQAGDVTDGIARLTQLAATNPYNAELHRLLGKAYLKAGDKVHAEAELRATMKIDPTDAGTRRILDSLLVKSAEPLPTTTQSEPR
jgi:Flp pilus assembly protein TadD